MPSNTETEILAATQQVLVETGYHGLTTAQVAEAAGVSQPLVHHYFETKSDLLAAFLGYYRGQVALGLEVLWPRPPGRRLAGLVSLLTENVADPDARAFYLAICELQAYAGRYDEYREELVAYNEMLQGFVVETIEEGIDEGAFRARNPRQTARLLLTAVDGALFQEATVGVDAVEQAVHGGLVEYVLAELYVEQPPDLERVELPPAERVADTPDQEHRGPQ